MTAPLGCGTLFVVLNFSRLHVKTALVYQAQNHIFNLIRLRKQKKSLHNTALSHPRLQFHPRDTQNITSPLLIRTTPTKRITLKHHFAAPLIVDRDTTKMNPLARISRMAIQPRFCTGEAFAPVFDARAFFEIRGEGGTGSRGDEAECEGGEEEEVCGVHGFFLGRRRG